MSPISSKTPLRQLMQPGFKRSIPSFATRARSCSSGSPAAVLNLQNRSFDALPEVSISTDLTPTPVLVTLGPVAGSAIGPEEGDLDGRLKTALDRIRRHGNRQELWIGELGWGIDRETRFDSIYARKTRRVSGPCLSDRPEPACRETADLVHRARSPRGKAV